MLNFKVAHIVGFGLTLFLLYTTHKNEFLSKHFPFQIQTGEKWQTYEAGIMKNTKYSPNRNPNSKPRLYIQECLSLHWWQNIVLRNLSYIRHQICQCSHLSEVSILFGATFLHSCILTLKKSEAEYQDNAAEGIGRGHHGYIRHLIKR